MRLGVFQQALNNNQISSIPLDIGYLKNLKKLSLVNNKLTTLP
jgi:Leucine-rich repeat (LRR) protein